MNSQLANFFECRSKRTVAVIAIAASILLGVLDLTTGIEIQLFLVYLIPIFLASWFVSQAVAIYVAILGSLVWFVADSLSGRVYSSQWIAYGNLLMCTSLFVVFALTQAYLRIKLDELTSLANSDFLTGLPNGRAFYRLASEEMNRAIGLEPLTLACIDITGMQLINERLGYPSGDQMMCTIAHTIRQNVARPDLVGRLAGTSFAVLLPNTASTGANLALEQLHNALKDERRKYSHPLNFYISAVACTKAPRTVAELMQEADSQMNRMKNAKTDFVQIVTSEGSGLLN
ncbi:MAG: GGDEF domain-containing protein [Candidatus Binatia bacterium]